MVSPQGSPSPLRSRRTYRFSTMVPPPQRAEHLPIISQLLSRQSTFGGGGGGRSENTTSWYEHEAVEGSGVSTVLQLHVTL